MLWGVRDAWNSTRCAATDSFCERRYMYNFGDVSSTERMADGDGSVFASEDDDRCLLLARRNVFLGPAHCWEKLLGKISVGWFCTTVLVCCIVSRSTVRIRPSVPVPECCAKLECFVLGPIRVFALFGLFPKFPRFQCFSDIGNVAWIVSYWDDCPKAAGIIVAHRR